jgi:hypothetical protein
MKRTELFDKKLELMFGDGDNEELKFLEKNIFQGKDYSDGIPFKDLKNIIMEVLGYRGKVLGIETYDRHGNLNIFHFEHYVRYYLNEWLVQAIEDISELGEGSRSYIYVSFPKSVLKRYL